MEKREILGFNFENKYEYENGFYLTSDSSRVGKLISHYELYKMITELGGAVVECGVYKGASLIRWASFREMLESEHSRKILAFDMFGEFPRTGNKEDDMFIEQFEETGGKGIDVESLDFIFQKKGFTNYELIKGDLTETIDMYLEKHPELKIALLHIDVDVYKPTMHILEKLYSHVVKGGIIALDDYGLVQGETSAVDDFLAKNHLDCKLLKLPFYVVPVYFFKS